MEKDFSFWLVKCGSFFIVDILNVKSLSVLINDFLFEEFLFREDFRILIKFNKEFLKLMKKLDDKVFFFEGKG